MISLDTVEHLAGRPVSDHTYKYWRCRCPGCTAAATATTRKARHARDNALLKVQARSTNRAAAWVRANCPALWEQIVADAYEELGIERRRPGRRAQGQP